MRRSFWAESGMNLGTLAYISLAIGRTCPFALEMQTDALEEV